MQNYTEPYLARYLHYKGNITGAPVAGNFELTPRCNFNCKMCYVHLSEQEQKKCGKELTADEWLTIAEEARRAGMVFLLLTGGEPLMRSDFFYIFSELKKMGFMVTINSNGYLLNNDTIEYFKKDPPFRINVTLYGGSDETYNTLCGVPAYSKVVSNLKALIQNNIAVKLNSSITPYNCNDVNLIFKTARELNIQLKATTYMHPPTRIDGNKTCFDSNRLTAYDAAKYAVECDKLRYSQQEFMQRAEAMLKGIAIPDNDDECADAEGNRVKCRAGRTSFWLTWDGKMLPCGMLTEPFAKPLESGFDNAWQYIRGETDKIHLAHECNSCRYKSICNVCAAVCYNETGKFTGKPDYVCDMIKNISMLTGEEYYKNK